MIRFGLFLMVLVVTLLAFTGVAASQSKPEFRLGFKALADQIPEVVGTPLEDEHWGINGDSLQQTSTGLMVWRKADNWTAFTDGFRTWVNGPFGIQNRNNDDRFLWETDDRSQPQPASQPAPGQQSVSEPEQLATPGYPRVNVHPSPGAPSWDKAPLFWFGKATEHDNYADVRIAYDSQMLYVYATIVDYYLWFDPAGTSDPRQYDAIALFLDISPERSSTLGTSDYMFVSGYQNNWPPGNNPLWHRQARGSSGVWDFDWSLPTPWTDDPGARWYDSGPNNNSDRDAGWATTITVPWAAVGLAGPPPSGSTLGIGMKLYDRDDSPPVPMQVVTPWPAGFNDAAPSSWGTLAIDPPAYAVPTVAAAGTTVIRRGMDTSIVKDSYIGGGGVCEGGIFGGGDNPHPTENLFVQNQSDVADFPCFSRSYLSFDLSSLPAGRKILSATLTLHQFGGSDPSQARPSLVQLFSVEGIWDENGLTWNNAPRVRENLSAATVPVLRDFPGWPGVASEWDATQAVAEAYAAGTPANLALYSADTAYHSGKYFVSSRTGDWNAVARPTLTITWGD